jgi:copper oxidase (laccase) domain-containing protein
MISYSEKLKLYYFPELQNLGIENFCTTKHYGNLSFKTNPEHAQNTINQIIKNYYPQNSTNDNFFFVMGTEGVDQIDEVTSQNLAMYKFLSSNQNFEKLTCDAIITDQKVWLIVSPADCMILVLVGRKNNNLFVAFVHLGFTGVILDLHKKVLNSLVVQDVNVIKAFAFPYISGKSYKRDFTDSKISILQNDSSWKDFLVKDENGLVEVHFGSRVIHYLTQQGIEVVDSGLDTYTLAQSNTLYSHYYSNKNNIDLGSRFAVGIRIR